MNARAYAKTLAALRRAVAQFSTSPNLEAFATLRGLDADSIERLDADAIRTLDRTMRRFRLADQRRHRAAQAARAAYRSFGHALDIAAENARAAAVPPPPKPPRKRRLRDDAIAAAQNAAASDAPAAADKPLLPMFRPQDGTPSDGAP